MKPKIFLGISFCILIGVIYYFSPKKISSEKLKIKCNYMAYACGDCYPQYLVKEILEGENKEVSKIINTEIIIEYEDSTIEKEVDKNTAKCVICYDFVFTGILKYSKIKGMYFIAQKVNYQLKNDSCCIEK